MGNADTQDLNEEKAAKEDAEDEREGRKICGSKIFTNRLVPFHPVGLNLTWELEERCKHSRAKLRTHLAHPVVNRCRGAEGVIFFYARPSGRPAVEGIVVSVLQVRTSIIGLAST